MGNKIVGIGGEAGVGKDTYADILAQHGYKKAAFADNLKEMCRAAFNLTHFHTDTQKGKLTKFRAPMPFNQAHFRIIRQWIVDSHGMTESLAKSLSAVQETYLTKQVLNTGKPLYFNTPREILQFVGTEICRAVSENYHTDVLLRRIKASPGKWVITDMRFPNERDVVREIGGILFRIKRPGYSPSLNTTDQQGTELLTEQQAAHASENSLGEDSEYNELIINDGTVLDLENTARSFLGVRLVQK